MKLVGRHAAVLGMVPAHERLEPVQPPVLDVALRLVEEAQALTVERLAEIGLQLESLARVDVHARLEQLHAVASRPA